MAHTPILDQINSPHDLRALPIPKLEQLAAEIRQRIYEVVSRTGGHLASNLGVVELTIALHYCFDFAADRLLWDVGHQCYVHKLLTGRREDFDRLRQADGLSGFPAPSESEQDLFAVGHAGTAISTAMGVAVADQKLGRDGATVAFVGDGSIVNGLAFEGLNNAGLLRRQFLVVLNDNSMAIDVTQGAFARYLAKVRTNHTVELLRKRGEAIIEHIPLIGRSMFEMIRHLKQAVKSALWPDTIYEQLGFMYLGPVDGHDLRTLIDILRGIRHVDHPVLLHAYTEKGRGYPVATRDPCAFHSPSPFQVDEGGKIIPLGGGKRAWTDAFADSLIELAERDERIVALTAAMPDGTGLNRFKERFADRYFDVGIAESHAVAMAAGLARAGLRPVVAVYSTFLQRGFDQVFQEVALQGLPVLFCMDRAGLVGSDGPVHHGFADLAYLRPLPGMTLMAPADEDELRSAMRLALTLDGPCAIRYPRDTVVPSLARPEPFVLGRSRRLRSGGDATVLAYGVTAAAAMKAADALADDGIACQVVSARFAKPLDHEMIERQIGGDRPVVTVEDHLLAGGFGSAVLEAAAEAGLDTRNVVRLGLPDDWVAVASRADQLAQAGIDAGGIARAVRELCGATGRRGGKLAATVRHAG